MLGSPIFGNRLLSLQFGSCRREILGMPLPDMGKSVSVGEDLAVP